MKHILCFGDSNLFGTNPSGGRWPLEQRWTGILARLLGEGYRIIEEGLGGRTTCFEDPLEPGRNGSLQLPIMLHSHRPLDLVIISLGTNDCKSLYNTNARVIAKALEKLSSMVKEYPYGDLYPVPQVLVISPIHVGQGIEESPFVSFDRKAIALSQSLAKEIEAMASKHGLLFFDASLVAASSDIDALHMDRQGHESLAKALLPLLLDWFGDKRPREALDDQFQKRAYTEIGEEGVVEESTLHTSENEGKDQTESTNKETVTLASPKRGRLPLAFSLFRRKR